MLARVYVAVGLLMLYNDNSTIVMLLSQYCCEILCAGAVNIKP